MSDKNIILPLLIGDTPYSMPELSAILNTCGIKCQNCKRWREPYDWDEVSDDEGECQSIVAYGGAWHNAGTFKDDFCNRFEARDDEYYDQKNAQEALKKKRMEEYKNMKIKYVRRQTPESNG